MWDSDSNLKYDITLSHHLGAPLTGQRVRESVCAKIHLVVRCSSMSGTFSAIASRVVDYLDDQRPAVIINSLDAGCIHRFDRKTCWADGVVPDRGCSGMLGR